MQKIRCLLVDDEPLALDALSTLAERISELEIIGRCRDAVEALQFIHEFEPDLIYLDIQMPELTGIEMLRSLEKPPKVIFTTAYREYAVEAFELDVIDYLVKPISLERLLKSVNRYHDRIRKGSPLPINPEPDKPGLIKNNTITLYSDKKTHRVRPSEILYVEGLKDYAVVHLSNKRLIIRQTMKNMEQLLSEYEFIRVHRSWIIPIRKVSSWTSYSLSIGEKEIPIGKTYRKPTLDYLIDNSR